MTLRLAFALATTLCSMQAASAGAPQQEPGARSLLAQAQTQPSAEDIFWQAIQSSSDPAMFQAYLDQVTKGVFSGVYKPLAEIKIATLRNAASPAPKPNEAPSARPLVIQDATTPAPATQQTAFLPEIEACDRAAAAPGDPEKPSNIPGVAPGLIDAGAAIRACRKAIALPGAPRRNFFQLGRALAKSGNLIDALISYKQAYALGHAGAMYNLAGLLRNGARGVNRDAGLAIALYEKAAAAGLNEAFVQLGAMYAGAIGVRRDYPRALEYYQRALATRTPEAYTNLGVLYFEGRGVGRDRNKACEYWREGSSLGEDTAARNLKRSCSAR